MEKLKILVRSVLTWMLFAFFNNLKIFVQLQHIRNIHVYCQLLNDNFLKSFFFIPWTKKPTNFSNFFYNKVYSFTFLGILDNGDFYFLTPFMKIAFFLGREFNYWFNYYAETAIIVVTRYWAAIARMNAWYYLDVNKIDIRNGRKDFLTSFFFLLGLQVKERKYVIFNIFIYFLPHSVQ